MNTLLKAEGIKKIFSNGRNRTFAVDGVDLELKERETLGIVGESGSGKSTLAKIIIGLLKPSSGMITLKGKPLREYAPKEKSLLIQMIFQDWQSSLNPKMAISKILSEGWTIHNRATFVPSSPDRSLGLSGAGESQERLDELLKDYELKTDLLSRNSRQLSGGQLQRVVIARALSLHPEILIADEPTSSLDPSLRQQILALFKEKVRKRGLSLVIISHDLDAVLYVSDRVLVMTHGKIVEESSSQELLKTPIHPYTLRLISSNPTLEHDEDWNDLERSFSWKGSCPFTRICPNVMAVCHREEPPWKKYNDTHGAKCHA